MWVWFLVVSVSQAAAKQQSKGLRSLLVGEWLGDSWVACLGRAADTHYQLCFCDRCFRGLIQCFELPWPDLD